MKLVNRTRKTSREENASQIHVDVVRSYVMHHCENFSWAPRALGLLRSRNWATLLELASQINKDLICSATRDSSALTETQYGSAACFKAASQFVALISKYPYTAREIPGLDPDAAAKRNLLAAERRNMRLNKVFAAHTRRGSDRHWCIPFMRAELLGCLGESPPYEDILDRCDFSGGSTTQHHGSATHLAVKLMGESLQGRVEALNYFKLALWRNDQYRRLFLPEVNGIVSLDRTLFEAVIDRLFEECDHNNITAVPKNALCSRTIAMEPPVLNFLQKGADLVMRHLLKTHFRIDLSRQEPNQLLAYRGSVDELDPYVTIDVRDASNSVIRELVRALVPAKWYRFLDHIRSPNYNLDGVTTPYEMFCSMGNGFCFPLETMIFASVCKAAARYAGVRPDFRCYGDDIVVRQSLALVVIECLAACGFRTNISKTFVFGPFRESCGANWYDGQAVTPGYYKETITSVQALQALHNSLPYPDVQGCIWDLADRYFGGGAYVEDSRQFAWVSNQAFRTTLDVAMSRGRARWSRKFQKWDFWINGTVPIPDDAWDENMSLYYRDELVHTAVLRGSSPEAPFHLRRSTRPQTSWTCDLSSSLIEAFRRGADPKRAGTRQLDVISSVILRLHYRCVQTWWSRRIKAAT